LVNKEDFSPEYAMDIPEANLTRLMNLLGIQNKCAAGLKHLAYPNTFSV